MQPSADYAGNCFQRYVAGGHTCFPGAYGDTGANSVSPCGKELIRMLRTVVGAAALAAALLLLRLVCAQIHWLWKLLLSGFLGFACLLLADLAGAGFGFWLPLRPASCLLVGLLGLPGLLLLAALELLL